MSIRIDLINQYPWLPSLKKFYSDLSEKPPTQFISEVFSGEFNQEIEERILKIVNAAFQNLEEVSDYKVDRLNVYVYLILRILIYVLDDKIITNRIANLYSKISYNELINDNNDSNLYEICQDLNLNVNYHNPPEKYGVQIFKNQKENLETNFSIHFIDYLSLASKLRDDYRKLVHNALSKSFVYITNQRLIRLIQEHVRYKLLLKETDDKKSLKAFIDQVLQNPNFKDLYDKILASWTAKKEEFDYSFEFSLENKENLINFYPPCVKDILKKAQEGQNLVHHERLFIVWFLIALELSVESVVNIFSTLPDFDREKTRYQVEFAQKKKYTPYQCSTLKTYNLCMAVKYKDELCVEGYGAKEISERKKLKHPLGYVRIQQYRDEKTKKYLKDKTQEKQLEEEKEVPKKENE